MVTDAIAMPRRMTPLAPVDRPPLVRNGMIAVIAVITSECMLFAGLIGSFLVFRLSAPAWPPADLPHLPLGVTALNTLVLLASLRPLAVALRAVHNADAPRADRALRTAAVLGLTFLLIQGVEWARLVRHGVTLGTSLYGATFYVLIGCHAVHVLVAVGWLAGLAVFAGSGRLVPGRVVLLETATVYWYFVCVLWLALFGLVYVF